MASSFGLTRKQVAMLAVIIFGTFIGVLNMTLVTPALPSIMRDTHVDASVAQWLTTGFTLVTAVMIPITAFFTDRFSVRNVFLAAMGLFTLGSLLAGWGPSFGVVLAGRLVQSAGEGVMMPLVGTVLMKTFPVERRGTAMGLFGIVIAFAPAIGPTLAGIIIDNATWHDLFYIVTVLSAAVVVAAFFVLERGRGERPDTRLDIPSVAASTVGFGSLLYGLSSVGSKGFDVVAGVTMAVGAVVLVFFFRRQLTMEQPMLRVSVLSNRRFLVSVVITMVVQAGLMAASVLMPIYLQNLRGFSATTTGLVMLPGAIIMGLMGLVAGRMFDKNGPRLLSLVGTGILAVTTFGFGFMNDSVGIAFLTALFTVRLFGMSLVNMPINTWGMNALDASLINHGNSVVNTLRQVAGALGTAVIVSVYTSVSTASTGELDPIHAGIHGFNMAFLVAGTLCLAGFVLTVLFVRDKPGETAKSDPDNARRTVLESVMRRDVYTLPANATVFDALRLFVERGISAAPLVDASGKAVGFVSDGDVLRFMSTRTQTVVDPIVLMSQTISDTAEGEGFSHKLDALMKMPAREIGARGVIGVDVHADLPEVCRVLGDNHLKKVAVLDEGRIVGVINRSDIAQYAMRLYVESRSGETAGAHAAA